VSLRHSERPGWLEIVIGVGFVVVMVLIFRAASSPNYEGDGSAFEITATVSRVTDESVFVKNVTVQRATGQADGWFTSKKLLYGANHNELHNNYWRPKWIINTKRHVGHVYDAHGSPMEISDLRVGATIHATGRIRASKQGKTRYDRAVFDKLTVVAP
jgi:hypothetical protein